MECQNIVFNAPVAVDCFSIVLSFLFHIRACKGSEAAQSVSDTNNQHWRTDFYRILYESSGIINFCPAKLVLKSTAMNPDETWKKASTVFGRWRCDNVEVKTINFIIDRLYSWFIVDKEGMSWLGAFWSKSTGVAK